MLKLHFLLLLIHQCDSNSYSYFSLAALELYLQIPPVLLCSIQVL